MEDNGLAKTMHLTQCQWDYTGKKFCSFEKKVFRKLPVQKLRMDRSWLSPCLGFSSCGYYLQVVIDIIFEPRKVEVGIDYELMFCSNAV